MANLMVFFILLLFITTSAAVSGITYEYNILIQENGNSIVIVNIREEGMHNFELPADVKEPKIKGALYIPTEEGIQLSVGSTKSAVLAYQTEIYTEKRDSIWTITIDKIKNDSIVRILLPVDVEIIEIEPESFVDEGKYKKLEFNDPKKITMSYSFKKKEFSLLKNLDKSKLSNKIIGLSAFMICIIGSFIAYRSIKKYNLFKLKKKTKTNNLPKEEETGKTKDNEGINDNKNNVLKTLSKNEKVVVVELLKNQGEMKRNMLERETKIAKSSLASTLFNLERKNIVEVDRKYVTHYVKLTEWFRNL